MRSTKPIPGEIKERNSRELKELSDQLSKIVERTSAIERHIETLEMAKEYRSNRIKAKSNEKVISPPRHSFDDVSISSIDIDISKTSPVQSFSKSIIGSQIASKPRTNQNTRQTPTLGLFLNMITQMRRDVSELATRQNEMKFELERIRARLC